MSGLTVDQICDAFPEGTAGNKIQIGYGTSGFRASVGVIAALRSISLDGAVIGVVITASHNPPQDNGVKIVDPSGSMLAGEWEQYATELSMPLTKNKFKIRLESILARTNIHINKSKARVFVATDTRESSPGLYEALLAGLNSLKTEHKYYGVQTTPLLHYMVRTSNLHSGPGKPLHIPNENLYYEQFSRAYVNLLGAAFGGEIPEGDSLAIDCANGVGTLLADEMAEHIPPDILTIFPFNYKTDEYFALNNQCGADFIKSTLHPPKNSVRFQLNRTCSFDGDADRVIFWYFDRDETLHILDGDRIAILMAEFLSEHINKSKLGTFNIGIVQTAYANRASTDYIKNVLKFPVVLSCTGVKNLHHAAAGMDVGVYFEPNGHGTVLFSEKFLDAINSPQSTNPQEMTSIKVLKHFYELLNQAAGDAMCDALAVCAILTIKNWSLREWKARYNNVPNMLEKVKVVDRNIFKTANFDTELCEPVNAKDFIETSVRETPGGRCFVRSSGTEDVVRVYAEADTDEDVSNLMRKICTFLTETFGSAQA